VDEQDGRSAPNSFRSPTHMHHACTPNMMGVVSLNNIQYANRFMPFNNMVPLLASITDDGETSACARDASWKDALPSLSPQWDSAASVMQAQLSPCAHVRIWLEGALFPRGTHGCHCRGCRCGFGADGRSRLRTFRAIRQSSIQT
jgi:hypothetical protein